MAALRELQLARAAEGEASDEDADAEAVSASDVSSPEAEVTAEALARAQAEADEEAELLAGAEEEQGSAAGDALASRPVAPKARGFDYAAWEREHAARHAAVNAHFAEVDAFELEEEDAGAVSSSDEEEEGLATRAPTLQPQPQRDPATHGGLEAILEACDDAEVEALAEGLDGLAVGIQDYSADREQVDEVCASGCDAPADAAEDEEVVSDSAAVAAPETDALRRDSLVAAVAEHHQRRRSSAAHRRSSVLAPPTLPAAAALRRSSSGHAAHRRSSIAATPALAVGRPSAVAAGRASIAPALAEVAEESATEGAVDADEEQSVTAAAVDAEDAEDGVDALPADATPMQALLHLCGQQEGELPSLDEFVVDRASDGSRVVKIGEGTFGEAFKAAEYVYKIMPIEGELIVNGEQQKMAEEVLSEGRIAHELSGLRHGGPRGEDTPADAPAPSTSGFIHCHAVGVCHGEYAPALLEAWDEFDERKGSENDRPGAFTAEQLYIVFAFADGGRDLEGFELGSFDEARGMLLQVAGALGAAEEAFGFEHRDLHWGNVLLSRPGNPRGRSKPRKASANETGSKPFEFTFNGRTARCLSGGLHMQLIDFTLSRLEAGGQVLFCNLEEDPEIFQGPAGVCQFDTYRRMRKVLRKHWESSNLRTNALWLHYLADTLLTDKAADMHLTGDQERALRGFRKRALGYDCAGDAVRDEIFDGMWILDDVKGTLGACPF